MGVAVKPIHLRLPSFFMIKSFLEIHTFIQNIVLKR